MTAPAERTKSMRAYADAFGEPDVDASKRMEQRLESMIAKDEARGGSGRRWLVWAVVVVLIGGAGVTVGIWLGQRGGDGVVTASSNPQRLRLAAGSVVLSPGAKLRVLHDDGRSVLELRAGAIDLDADEGGAGMQVLSGPYTVEALGARLRVEHTDSVPVVTVTTGEAIVRGPNLPGDGVLVVPVASPASD